MPNEPLSAETLASIEEGIDDIRNGRTITFEEYRLTRGLRGQTLSRWLADGIAWWEIERLRDCRKAEWAGSVGWKTVNFLQCQAD